MKRPKLSKSKRTQNLMIRPTLELGAVPKGIKQGFILSIRITRFSNATYFKLFQCSTIFYLNFMYEVILTFYLVN